MLAQKSNNQNFQFASTFCLNLIELCLLSIYWAVVWSIMEEDVVYTHWKFPCLCIQVLHDTHIEMPLLGVTNQCPLSNMQETKTLDSSFQWLLCSSLKCNFLNVWFWTMLSSKISRAFRSGLPYNAGKGAVLGGKGRDDNRIIRHMLIFIDSTEICTSLIGVWWKIEINYFWISWFAVHALVLSISVAK
jgi:hypothetical protein